MLRSTVQQLYAAQCPCARRLRRGDAEVVKSMIRSGLNRIMLHEYASDQAYGAALLIPSEAKGILRRLGMERLKDGFGNLLFRQRTEE